MPYHIRNTSGEIWFTTTAWFRLLQLAINYGWEPDSLWFDLQNEPVDGVSPYRIESNQTQNNLSPKGILVTAQEALPLARALERALPDLPDHDAKAHLRHQRGGGIDCQEEEKLAALEWFSGTNKARIKEFIGLCQRDGFTLS